MNKPAAHADAAAEAIRAFNHATLPGRDGLTEPADAYQVLANLSSLAHRLRQAINRPSTTSTEKKPPAASASSTVNTATTRAQPSTRADNSPAPQPRTRPRWQARCMLHNRH